MPHAIPAATLVVFREREGRPPTLLMVERSCAMAFAAGAWVFPGGRIDPGDEAIAASIAPERPDGAARIAAIRETLEETGVAIGFDADPATLAAIRAGLHGGVTFGDLLGGTPLDLDALTPFARWLPAQRHVRVFDTHFFLASAPAQAEASVDRTENMRLAWIAAVDLLAQVDAGKATVIFPTRRNLERLARFADLAAALADARAHPVRTITPFVERRNGIEHLCIPDDIGYPITGEPLTDAVRG